MSKRRRRSEVSETDSEEFPSVGKKHCGDEWTVPGDLNAETELCTKLYDFLRKYKDDSNSCLAEFLFRAPSRRLQPDYYDVISNPIDLLRIQQKLKTDNYKTVQDFINDIKLLFDNAKAYHLPSSDEFKAAVTLESSFLDHLKEFGFSRGYTSRSSPFSSLTLRIPKTQLSGPIVCPPQSQRTSSSSESGVNTTKPTSSTLKQTSAGKGSSKTTRSRAWIDEYIASSEPQKIYLALVYNYHDSSGDYVAEVFQVLPSRKEYPEYYRIITEPIDLNTIKKNVDNGHYGSFKALQEDMILMVKNARYFNEPGSVLYKKASILRKFIINKGAELYRKFVQSTAPQLKVSLQRTDSQTGSETEGDGRKVPKLSIKKSEEGAMKVQQSQPSPEPDESQSDSSEDDLFSDEPGDKQQFMLRIKKDKLANKTPANPLSKLLQAKRTPVLRKCLLAIYRCLMTKTTQGRLVCELFKKRPSARVYPEYYLVIKQPIDLREIRDKIKTGQYSSVDELVSDVELLVNNACTFNEEDSIVYADALTIRQTAQEAVQQIQQRWPELFPALRGTKPKKISVSGTSIKSPGLKTDTEASSRDVRVDVKELFTAIKECTDNHGRQLWRTFEKLPSSTTAGDYFSVVKKPTDMSIINTKLTHGLYPSVDPLFEDLTLLFDNAYGYYSKDSTPSKDSIVLHRVSVKKYQQLRAAEREANPVPDVKDCVQKIIRETITRTLNYKDASGHCPAQALHSLVAMEEFPHPDLPETIVHRSVTLPKIKEWACQGMYPRLDQMQKDLLLVLRKGREQLESHTYKESVAVERRWIQMRDETCKGSVLVSPALSHTTSTLDAELALQAEHDHRPPTPHPRSSPSTASESSVGPDEEEGVVSGGDKEEEDDNNEIVVDKRDVEYMTECEYAGARYRVGDVVYLKASPGSDREPHIVLVESLWRDKSGNLWLDGCWFYRPAETFHAATKKFYEKEVFKSDFRSFAKLSRVTGRCGVLGLRDYVKYRIEGISDEDTYLCESRYWNKARSFKKIKMWSMPGAQPRLLRRDTLLTLHKVPSVFAELTGPTEEKMEVDGEGGDGLSDEEKLSLSFSANLKNVMITVTNPEPNCTYYEQYCIDNNQFRLGDFVFLRSDQELAYISKIERMWTDSNDDPWIYGPWYIRPQDVAHPPTRVFYEKELFQSNISDPNPMRSICGRCVVVSLSDYCKKRSTQYHEDDVYITESRYNESEKKTVKLKGFKRHQLSESITPEEVYFFPKEIVPIKAPSPKLFTKEYSVEFSPPSSKEQTSSRASTPASGSSVSTPPTSLALQAQLVKKQPNIININPQLVQQLLASASKLVMTSKGPMTLPASTPAAQSPTSSVTTPTTTAAKQTPANKPQTSCVCQWTGCGKVFQNVIELGTHLLTTGVHIVRDDVRGNYYCKWKGCHRNPLIGGKPFNGVAKLTRHLREVHLWKISNSILGLSPLTGAAIASLASPSPTTPAPATPKVSQLSDKETQNIARVVQASNKQTAAASSDGPSSGQAGSSKDAPKAPPVTQTSIFLPPPENRRQISHSAIYMNYIKGLQSNSKYMSSYKESSEARPSSKPPAPLKPSDWLGPEAMAVSKDSKSVADALWALRDHLLKESTKLDRFNKSL